MAHSHCMGLGTGPGPGSGMIGLYIMSLTVYNAQRLGMGQEWDQALMACIPISSFLVPVPVPFPFPVPCSMYERLSIVVVTLNRMVRVNT